MKNLHIIAFQDVEVNLKSNDIFKKSTIVNPKILIKQDFILIAMMRMIFINL